MKSKKVKKALLLIILSALAILLPVVSYLRLLDNYELVTLDIRFLTRLNPPVTDKIVIIEIGDDSIRKLGRFPFDRSYHAAITSALSDFGAKAIVFDMLFSEPHERDPEFEAAVQKAGTVYMPFVFDIDTPKGGIIQARGYAAECMPNFAALAKGTGHINIIPDIDGKFRRIPLCIRYGNTIYPHLAFLAACDYMGIGEHDIEISQGGYLRCGKKMKAPLDDNHTMIINFAGRWGETYKHYSYVDVVQSYFASLSGQKGSLDPASFKDKICVIGLTATGTGELHPSPFEPLYPAVGIFAEVFNSLVNRRFIVRLSREANLFILVFMALAVSIMTLKTRPVRGLSGLILAVLFFTASSVFLFAFFGIWIDWIYPVLAMVLLYLSLTLYKYIDEWKRRLVLENELEIAKRIQESFLPKKLPVVNGLDVAAAMFAARKVGGDLYYFLEFAPDRLGVVIGDVSGKGIPASLFMAMVSAEFKFFATPETSPEDVLSGLNSKLVKESSSNLFVTIFYLIFDMRNRSVKYANGGHIPVLHLKPTGSIEFLDVSDGLPLGLMDSRYSVRELKFDREDVFVLCTDGVTEAMNSRSEMYGKERLAAIVEKNRNASSKELLEAIEKDVRRFEPQSKQHDDMVLIVIKIV